IFLDARSIMTSRTGGGFFDVNMGGPSGPQFTVNVVPEPSTVGLAVIGGAALLLVVWRKQRTCA
ncbi:MAG: PEP-CTERM sorting domain-containing protein, partial [Chthoniobacterales bacterium]